MDDYRAFFGEERPNRLSLVWIALLAVWCLVLCLIPDPRPLGAPDWVVSRLQRASSLSEPAARMAATIVLRSGGLIVLGLLLAISLKNLSPVKAWSIALLGAPLLGVCCQAFNYGHFPWAAQLQLCLFSTTLGTLLGLALFRSRRAIGALAVPLAGLYLYGSAVGVTNDLYEDARDTGVYLLDCVDDLSEGEQLFVELFELAFRYAEDNSHRADAIHANQAAILALGVIVGDERVAKFAKRPIEIERGDAVAKLRNRVRIYSRHDLPRHFWVSAALVVVSDKNTAKTIGIGKELMDATSGGTGFSFVDLLANFAGINFAVTATQDDLHARRIQRLAAEDLIDSDFIPDISGLPEGMTGLEFASQFGGIGGNETQRLMKEIEVRLQECKALKTDH
jgi:hypothetical protein